LLILPIYRIWIGTVFICGDEFQNFNIIGLYLDFVWHIWETFVIFLFMFCFPRMSWYMNVHRLEWSRALHNFLLMTSWPMIILSWLGKSTLTIISRHRWISGLLSFCLMQCFVVVKVWDYCQVKLSVLFLRFPLNFKFLISAEKILNYLLSTSSRGNAKWWLQKISDKRRPTELVLTTIRPCFVFLKTAFFYFYHFCIIRLPLPSYI